MGGRNMKISPVKDSNREQVKQGKAILEAFIANPNPSNAEAIQVLKIVCRGILWLVRNK
jgi:hypothetical protein